MITDLPYIQKNRLKAYEVFSKTYGYLKNQSPRRPNFVTIARDNR